MADNYLEKRYETYLIQKAEYERKKKLGLIPQKKNVKKDEKSSQ